MGVYLGGSGQYLLYKMRGRGGVKTFRFGVSEDLITYRIKSLNTKLKILRIVETKFLLNFFAKLHVMLPAAS